MNDVKELSNINGVYVSDVVSMLSKSYANLINNNLPLNIFPSVMMWGQPGVGKSQGVKQIAEEVEKLTSKKVVVTDVRLLLFNPIDLRGIPVANNDKTLAIWLKPKILDMDPSENIVNILFLDEISAAPQTVQAAAYQLVLDRKIGEHALPDNCFVIAAGNRVTDKSVAYKMPKALANRFLHLNIETNFNAWVNWAVTHGIHPIVTAFLASRPSLLNTYNSTDDSNVFATPRSWEMVSNILNNVSTDFNFIRPLIAGLVGEGITLNLKTFFNLEFDLPKISDIFNGKDVPIKKEAPWLYAVVSSMVHYVQNNEISVENLANSLNFARKLPNEFKVFLLKNYFTNNKKYEKRLRQLILDPSLVRFASEISTMSGDGDGIFRK